MSYPELLRTTDQKIDSVITYNEAIKAKFQEFEGTINTPAYNFYVDGNRTDTYTENGSIGKPYKKISDCITAIQALADVQIALGTQAAYDTTRYIINVAGGTYSDNLTIGNMKYLAIVLCGATISGTITNNTSMIGGAVSDYYSKLEFIGVPSSRAYRGRCGLLSGVITFTRNNDSLHYVNFTGVEVSNNVQFGTASAASEGTYVVGLQNAYFSGTSKYISEYLTSASSNVLLESFGYNIVKCKLAKQNDASTKIQLYNCNNTDFSGTINITPYENGTVKNCTFPSTVSIVASKTLSIDANSYNNLISKTETLTGMTITLLDSYLPAAAAQEEIAAGTGGAINLTSFCTFISTDAGGDDFTLADGTIIGQQKKIVLRVDGGGDAVVSGSFTGTNNRLTFSDAGEYALLQWNGTDWIALELASVLDLTNAPALSTSV